MASPNAYVSTILQRQDVGYSNTYRGKALLINMEKYKHHAHREGAEFDRGKMDGIFKMLHFDVTSFKDHTAKELKFEMRSTSKDICKVDTDCFVCFVSAHGNTDESGNPYIEDQNGDKVDVIKDIIEPFMESIELQGKPKVFFINACRGEYKMTSRKLEADKTTTMRSPTTPSTQRMIKYLDNKKDVLVVFSTEEGNQSGRDKENGTYFVQALCRAIPENCDKEDVETMVTKANMILTSSPEFREHPQVATTISKLTRKLFWLKTIPRSSIGKVVPPEPIGKRLLLVYDCKISESQQPSELDVVLFHSYEFGNRGWHHVALSSWFTNSSEPICWPVEWLARELGIPIRVFCVNYSAGADSMEKPMPSCKDQKFDNLAKQIREDLFRDRVATVPLLFIGHGLGGLLIKSVLNNGEQEVRQHLKDRLRGIVFYGVPYVPREPNSHGKEDFSLEGLKHALQVEEGHLSVIQEAELKNILRGKSPAINQEHNRFCKSFKEEILSFEEGQETHGYHIVTPSKLYATDVNTIVEDCSKCNHFDICRPTSVKDKVFTDLLGFIRKQCQNLGQAKIQVNDGKLIVGQKSHFEKLKECLMLRGKASVAGITGGQTFGVVGMGGIGKTTLAKSLCEDDDIRDYYDHRVYWVAMKRNPNIVKRQTRLIYELCKEMPSTSLDTEKCLQEELEMKLKRMKKVLLFLDDVWEKEHVDRLLGDSFMKTLPPGSKCVITSRKPTELAKLDGNAEIQKLDILSDEDAKTLFCYKAFSRENLPVSMEKNLQDAVNEVISACGNMPILLATVGAERWGKRNIESWKNVRDRLQNAKASGNGCDDEESTKHQMMLIRQVKISYDDLPESDPMSGDGTNFKDYFLDFAAFPEHEEIEIAMLMDMWTNPNLNEDGAYRILEELEQRCLVKIVGYWCYVHDIFRALAVQIVEEPVIEKRRRLFAWNIGNRLPEQWISHVVRPDNFEGDPSTSKHQIVLNAEKMVIARSVLKQFHPKDSILFMCLARLHMLILTSNLNLVSLPSAIRHMICLEKLDISWCLSLKSLPQEIGELQSLQKVNMAGCCSLDKIPPTIGNLKKLLELNMQSCGVGKLPPEIGNLSSLTYLCLNDCNKLEVLPPEIGKLSNLEKLECDMLHVPNIPKAFGCLTMLKHMSISACDGITEIPVQIGKLKNLESLWCKSSRNLHLVPMELDKLVSEEGMLMVFNISNTSVNREELPPGLRALQKQFDINPRDNAEAAKSMTKLHPEYMLDWTHKRGELAVDHLSMYDPHNKQERRVSFGLARIVALAKMEPFMSPRFYMAIRIMRTMANHSGTRHAILQNGGIPVLLRCVDKGLPELCGENATAALCNICVTFSTHKAIVDARGLEILTRVLHRKNTVSDWAYQALEIIMDADCQEHDYTYTSEIYERCGHIFQAHDCACILCQLERKRHPIA